MKSRKNLLILAAVLFTWVIQFSAGAHSGQAQQRGKNGSAKATANEDSQKDKHDGHHPARGNIMSRPNAAIKLSEAGGPQADKQVRAVEPEGNEEVKLSVDLVVLDAQVMQQKTGRIVGDLTREDFALYEDGIRQQVTHFGQDTLPLSVIFLIDRGGCLDPFGDKVRRATLESLERLKPQDEVALMAFHNTAELVSGFSRNKSRIRNALDHVPPHDEQASHCFNRAFYDAAEYMSRAANPDGRRVIIIITALTTAIDCAGPTGEQARLAVLESGSVVCAIIPKTTGQRMENGAMRAITGIAGVFKAKTTKISQLAEETGGEIMTDKPDNLDRTFHELIDHIRTRYIIGFVSTNAKRDGSFRKLKLGVSEDAEKRQGKLVVRTRRGYIAAREGRASRANTSTN